MANNPIVAQAAPGGKASADAEGATLSDRVAGRIRELRKKTGLSQAEFAARIGFERSYYGQVENNRIKPSLELIVQIGQAFAREFPQASAHNIIYDPPIFGQVNKYSPHSYFVKHLDAGALRCVLSNIDAQEMKNGKGFSADLKTILFLELLTTYERTILQALEGGDKEFVARQKAELECSRLVDTFGPAAP